MAEPDLSRAPMTDLQGGKLSGDELRIVGA